jgi:hypothetical protein
VEQVAVFDQPILRIEEERREDFVPGMRQRQTEVLAYALRRVEHGRALDVLAQRAPRQFDHRRQLGVLGRPETRQRLHVGACGREQAVQSLEPDQGVARDLERIAAGDAGPQEHGQQLGFGQCLRAHREQLLPRALARRPVLDRHRHPLE